MTYFLYSSVSSIHTLPKEGSETLRIFPKTILLLMLLSVFSCLQAAKYTTKQNGNWTTNSTWENNTPPPLVGTGNSAMYTDSIIVKHKINIGNNTIRIADYLEVMTNGRIYSGNSNNGLVILINAVAVNYDSIDLNNVDINGQLFNYKYLKARDLTVSNSGYLFIGSQGYVQTQNPANNQGTIFNMGTLYSPSNFINNNGTLTGNGGNFLVDGNLTNNAGGLLTCSGNPINICRTNNTNPTINGSGTIDSSCILICGVPLGGSGLPVQLVSFTARVELPDGVILEWVTASEINNSHFEIFKSEDGTNWMLIDTVFSQFIHSSTPLHYEYIDRTVNNSVAAKTLYYRLKQVDTDGYHEIFPSIFIVMSPHQPIGFQLYPNPVNNQLHIHLASSSVKTPGTISMVDVYGRKILFQPLKTDSHILSLDVSDVASGVYYVIISLNGEELVQPVWIKH